MNTILVSYDVGGIKNTNVSEIVEHVFQELKHIKSFEKGLRSEWLVKTKKSADWVYEKTHSAIMDIPGVNPDNLKLYVFDLFVDESRFSQNLCSLENWVAQY